MSKSTPLSETSRGSRAFTLVEILTAMFVAVILITVVYTILAQMRAGIRSSVQRARVTLAAQAMDYRFRTDFAAMLGPNSTLARPAGAIVIVPAVREGYVPLPGGRRMSASKVRLRADQLAIVTDTTQQTWTNAGQVSGQPWRSVLPANVHASAPVQSTQAVVWYGPVRSSAVTPRDGTSDDPFWQAHNWMFGRQLKLLTGGTLDVAQLGVTPGQDAVPGTVEGLADLATGRRRVGPMDPTGQEVRGPGGWSVADYISHLAVSPTDQANVPSGVSASSYQNFTNIPVDQTDIDTLQYRLQPDDTAKGVQLSDIQQANLRLFDHCSEIVVQWAGDLDKDGNIDIYPSSSQPYDPAAATQVSATAVNYPGHPLGGSIVWYPDEVHDHGAWYNGGAGPLSRSTATMDPVRRSLYQNQIVPFGWYQATDFAAVKVGSFPRGFLGPALARFGGHGDQTANWYNGFTFEYGEQDNPGGKTTNPTIGMPQPYVFRFDDDQHRRVRFGFRQDGSVWSNRFDGNPVPATGGAPGSHLFPYPPSLYGIPTERPDPVALYSRLPDPIVAPELGPVALPNGTARADGKGASDAWNPPAGPYPVSTPIGTTDFAAARGGPGGPFAYPGPYNNWASMPAKIRPREQIGAFGQWWQPLIQVSLFGSGPFRTAPSTAYPLGRLVTVDCRIPQAGKTAINNHAFFAVALGGASSAGAEQIFDPDTVFRTPGSTLNPAGLQLRWSPSDEPGFAPGAMGPSGMAAPDPARTITGNGWFVAKVGGAPAGTEPLLDVSPYSYMPGYFGAANNRSVNYRDIYDEYLVPVNTPSTQGTKVDWRNPQSDWPKLIRIRLRLHDAQGEITSASDDFALNGRDDDGDGVVDNPEEATISGVWYEYVMPVPYPRDPTPRLNTP